MVTIPKVKYTNVNCLVSYKIMADRSEPKVEVTLGMCFFFKSKFIPCLWKNMICVPMSIY